MWPTNQKGISYTALPAKSSLGENSVSPEPGYQVIVCRYAVLPPQDDSTTEHLSGGEEEAESAHFMVRGAPWGGMKV